MTGKFRYFRGQAGLRQENFVNLWLEDILSFKMSPCLSKIFTTGNFRESAPENFLFYSIPLILKIRPSCMCIEKARAGHYPIFCTRVCQRGLQKCTLSLAIFWKKTPFLLQFFGKNHALSCVFAEKGTLDVGTPTVPYIQEVPPPGEKGSLASCFKPPLQGICSKTIYEIRHFNNKLDVIQNIFQQYFVEVNF